MIKLCASHEKLRMTWRMLTTAKCSKCGNLSSLFILPDGSFQVEPCPICIKQNEGCDGAWKRGYKKGFDEGWEQGYLQG
jgi:hypothetical protein